MTVVSCPECGCDVDAENLDELLHCAECHYQFFHVPPKKQSSEIPINANALLKQLCPYCSTHLGLKQGAEVCSSCGKDISWITSEYTNIYGNLTVGICKPGEEEEEAKAIMNRLTTEFKAQHKQYLAKLTLQTDPELGAELFLSVCCSS